jgi:phage tail-like protein
MTELNSQYIRYLPPIFQESEFLDGYLLAFEKIFTQAALSDDWLALETKIAQSDRYIRPLRSNDVPRQTPANFLAWLAGWVALSLRDDWPEETQRRFIREIVPLYRLRGTKKGLECMLKIYLGDNVPIQIYDRNVENEFAFDPPPHFFQVRIDVNTQDTTIIRQIQQIAQAIIEQEKPAHTFYGMQIRMPTMRLLSEDLAEELGQDRLVLGKNTLLGTQQV